jgi:hypothetical protein
VSVLCGGVDRRVGRDGNVEAGTAQLDGEVERPAERIHVAGDGVHLRDPEVEPFEAGHVRLCATPRCCGFVLGDTGGKSERDEQVVPGASDRRRGSISSNLSPLAVVVENSRLLIGLPP